MAGTCWSVRRLARVLGWGLAGLMLATVADASAEGAESEPGRAVRAYDSPATELWSEVLALIGELGIVGEKAVAEHGVLVSRFTPLSVLAPAGLRAPRLGPGLTPLEVQFHVFVPQRVEKPRVVVGSIVAATSSADGKRTHVYGSVPLENWLLDRLDKRLKARGVPFSDPPAECEQSAQPPDGQVKRPTKVSDVTPRYSGTGMVEVSYRVDRDGTVRAVTATGGDEPMREAATGAVSLWRYQPARLNNCTVPVAARARLTFRPAREP